MIYLDNNAGTLMPLQVINEINHWFNTGNPSASYESAKDATRMMDGFRKWLRNLYGAHFDKVIFTSSASESNATIIKGVKGAGPLITSAIEHPSIISLLVDEDIKVQPRDGGLIWSMDVETAILRAPARPRLVSIMHVNNETGVINNINSIAEVCRRLGVPFHCDVVQSAGKLPDSIKAAAPDAISITFGKCLGPVCGALLLNTKRISVEPLIGGTQNGGLRGGTENVPMIAGAYAGLKITMKDRAQKNAILMGLKKHIITRLHMEGFRVITYKDYNGITGSMPMVVMLGENTICSTLLMSVIIPGRPEKCNARLREQLTKMGIIISIGSACNTSSEKASHVLHAMGYDATIRRGAIRVSLGDYNNEAECNAFVAAVAMWAKK